ncbi:MAG: DEAD/DEAH box helicase [Anaerolineae bacterium]|nr:DEAD/DEAH box helicase [Anaerolineae bacterium]
MAQLIPATPIQGSSPELIRLFNVLKRLPEEVVVCQRLPVLHGSGPDFCLIWTQRLLFMSVSDATPLDVQRSEQLDLFGEKAKPVGVEEEERLSLFLQTLPAKCALPGAVLFPNVPDKQLSLLQRPEKLYAWVGKEHLSPDRLVGWVNGRLSAPLSPAQIDHVRQLFTPEVVVPSVFTVRQPVERHTEAELANYLLDYDQEHALKLDLNLTKTGHETAKDFKLRLINGVAGSGKSLIVIYRAYMLHRLFPDKKILLLTHNRALIHDLRRRYGRLSDGDESVEMHTFMGWCRRHWPKDKVWRDLVRYRDRLDLVTQVWHEQLRDTAVSEQMLMDEIDWYKDRLLFSEADYLAADRSGRGFALSDQMRQRVYTAMERYHHGLQQRQLMDWGDVPRLLWRLWHEGEVALPRYDIILVDEAQFFAPLWFEIIKRILTPQTGHLFLVADASQGFLKRGQSWLASGLEVRGRVHRLTKSYRTTREILDFATLLYRRRLPQEDEDVVIPDVDHMPHGVLPVVIPLTSEQDEVTRVINEIGQLHQNGVPWRDILVIHASREETSHIANRLNRVFGVDTAVDPGKDNPQDQIRVCSLNAATGLESPIVFLMGIHDLYEMEQSIRLAEEERAELVRDNTRKLYMAITRAGQRLVITYVGPLPELLKTPGESSVNKMIGD